ncbi:MAG: hypothetical protein WCF20_11960 [Methylovirgula sp.]
MIDASKILAGLPAGLRDPLLKHFAEIATNFIERRWEPAELNGGKLSEVVYSILEGAITGKFPTTPSKPKDMVQACRALEGAPSNPSRVGDRSIRILIPRMLVALYEIRNNRNVGHVGGDVDPNLLDATAVYEMTSWILAELVRIFHGISIEQARATVDALVERRVPLIWEIGEVKRVQDSSMSTQDQTLLLLHASPGWVSDKILSDSVEYSGVSMFRTRVLEPLHKKRLIEFDRSNSRAHISPQGSKFVSDKILKPRASTFN